MGVSRRGFLTAAGAGVLTSGLSNMAWAKVLPSALNAQNFGVKTGGGDQSAALQRAIDQAVLKQIPLFLPGGDYAASNITIPSGLQFIGVPGQSTLSYNSGGGLLDASGARNVSLRGLSLKGNNLDLSSASGALFVANDTTRLLMEDCRIFDSSANCISLNSVSGQISSCELAGARQAALFSIDARGLTLTSNYVHDCDNNGILVWRSQKSEDGTIVSQNRIENIKTVDGGSGQNGNGINIFRAFNVIAAQNRISDCAFSAVRSNAGSAVQIIGNSCSRIKEVALYAEFGFEGAVIAQNIVEDAAAGVSITNFNNGGRLGICANNIIRNLFIRKGNEDERGIGIGVEADTVVTGNLVENAPRIGIAMGWGKYMRDVSATNNIIRKSRIGIGVSITFGAGRALISNNLISGAQTHAIAGSDYKNTLPQDLIKPANAAAFTNLTLLGNVAN
jgi:uncharacterized secreted repeat protein (TIGR03808 family)